MGADFKEKAKRTFEKCWDKAALAANTPDLFSRTADRAPSRFEAEAISGASIAIGDSFSVRMEGNELVGRRGTSPVIRLSNPSQTLVSSIAQGCNIARADIVASDPISGIFEVTIH
ncbi:hypothetical protein SAMN05518668_11638 [Sphingobium sp. YR657]|uniref:hypothetical protein n=1 Tax=Sphingobium sp. YR657 TaxID=1884366 RepID=UPI0009160620|nr:hypothetical protein [Sphingobium sp. YR657]SHM66752.1 hypothetical protein SAMN05518668_11638 [Sphingobium sp. YR657]